MYSMIRISQLQDEETKKMGNCSTQNAEGDARLAISGVEVMSWTSIPGEEGLVTASMGVGSSYLQR